MPPVESDAHLRNLNYSLQCFALLKNVKGFSKYWYTGYRLRSAIFYYFCKTRPGLFTYYQSVAFALGGKHVHCIQKNVQGGTIIMIIEKIWAKSIKLCESLRFITLDQSPVHFFEPPRCLLCTVSVCPFITESPWI